jgi:hypothetical protein
MAFMPPRFGAIRSGAVYDRAPRVAVSEVVGGGGDGGGDGGGPTISGPWPVTAGRALGGGRAGRCAGTGMLGPCAAVLTMAGISKDPGGMTTGIRFMPPMVYVMSLVAAAPRSQDGGLPCPASWARAAGVAAETVPGRRSRVLDHFRRGAPRPEAESQDVALEPGWRACGRQF